MLETLYFQAGFSQGRIAGLDFMKQDSGRDSDKFHIALNYLDNAAAVHVLDFFAMQGGYCPLLSTKFNCNNADFRTI